MRNWRKKTTLGRYVIGAGLLLLIVLFGGIFAAATAGQPVRVGEQAPQFEIQGFNSQKLVGEKNLLLVFYRGHF